MMTIQTVVHTEVMSEIVNKRNDKEMSEIVNKRNDKEMSEIVNKRNDKLTCNRSHTI
jgi:hypothetical protein